MTTREAFPNPARPFRWPGEEDHYRSGFQIGDIVRVDDGSGYLARITCWNNTWSHVKGGRIAMLQPLLAYPGTQVAEAEKRKPYDNRIGSEDKLTAAHPGDVGAHIYYPSGKPGTDWQSIPASWTR
jgi:hypothetical protein